MFKKTFLLALVIMFGFSTLFFAQDMGRMSPEERAKQLTERLNLNKEQAKKVAEIYTNQQNEMFKIMESGGGFGDETTRTKMTALRDSSNNKIMKLLTAKQKIEFKKVLEEQRKRMEEMRRNMGMGN